MPADPRRDPPTEGGWGHAPHDRNQHYWRPQLRVWGDAPVYQAACNALRLAETVQSGTDHPRCLKCVKKVVPVDA